jgi:hypothetical protein
VPRQTVIWRKRNTFPAGYSRLGKHQYNETNVMHFSFNLLRIKGLYMFRALLAHPQEELHKLHLVYCVRIMSVGCGMVAVKMQPCQSQLTLYTRNIPNAVSLAPPEDEQVMLETCRGLWFSINWMKSASHWFQYTDILWCTVSKTFRLWKIRLSNKPVRKNVWRKISGNSISQ